MRNALGTIAFWIVVISVGSLCVYFLAVDVRDLRALVR